MKRVGLCILSTQELDIPQHMKDLYKTVWEIRQRVLVDMAADRGAFIDQSQSFNVHMSDVNFGKLTSLHFYAWKVRFCVSQPTVCTLQPPLVRVCECVDCQFLSCPAKEENSALLLRRSMCLRSAEGTEDGDVLSAHARSGGRHQVHRRPAGAPLLRSATRALAALPVVYECSVTASLATYR